MPLSPPSEPRAPAIVRTVLGDIAAERLGWTLSHEHLIARIPSWVDDADLHLLDEHVAAQELERFGAAGGTALVEMSTVDYGRDAAALVRLSEASDVHLVATTGFNTRRFAAPWLARLGDEALAAWMVSEVRGGLVPYVTLEQGIAALGDAASPRTPARAGLIKVATGAGEPSADELRVLPQPATLARVRPPRRGPGGRRRSEGERVDAT